MKLLTFIKATEVNKLGSIIKESESAWAIYSIMANFYFLFWASSIENFKSDIFYQVHLFKISF